MRKISLKLKLILAFTLIAAVVFGAAAVVSHKEAREEVDGFFDMYQMALARRLAVADWSTVTPATQRAATKLTDKVAMDAEEESVAFAIFDTHGQLVFHDGENGGLFTYTPHTGRFVQQEFDGEPWRMIWMPTVDGRYMITVGQSLDYRQDIIFEMTEEFMLPWGIGLVVMLTLIILVITVAFFPVTKLAKNLRKRRADNLSPLSADKLPAEIQPLIDAMNTLLCKIEHMLARERSFIADSAHELRTPLTALKVQLEVLELAGDDTELRQAAFDKLSAGIDRSTRLVEQLLALSKAESVAASSEAEKLNWRSIAEQLIMEHQTEAAARDMTVTLLPDGKGPFEKGCPILATLLLRNLIDNALKYSPEKAQVTIHLQHKSVTVTNTGVQVDKTVLERLGQRFYRPAGQNQTGSGLGLSIVSRIAQIYRCKTHCENTINGFSVTVRAH